MAKKGWTKKIAINKRNEKTETGERIMRLQEKR